MKNRWKTISIISWIVLAIVLALGIILTVSGKHEAASLKAEVEKYKSLAMAKDEASPSDNAQSEKESQQSGQDASTAKEEKSAKEKSNTSVTQTVVYQEKEVPKYIYVAVEPEKSENTEPATEEPTTEDPGEEETQEPEKDESNIGNLAFSEGVTYQMCDANYWKSKIDNADAVLKTKEEIAAFNQTIVETEGTRMYDLNSIAESFDGDSIKSSLAGEATPSSTLYKNGELMSEEEKAAYFDDIKANILSANTSENDTVKYAVVSRRADMKAWPTADYIGYSQRDTDEELTLFSMNINEPFVVKVITGDGQYAWGYSNVCTGWVNTNDLAFCKDKDEWNDAWNMTDDNFLVVTTDRLTLEPSYLTPETSALKLMIGTKLKMVPEDLIPDMIGERSRINNYVVYVPVRDDDGSYVKAMALISQNKDMGVHVGYVPLTAGNLIDLSFNCLGDRYGWGGMLESMDCSQFTRTIYSCCGIELPRNTNWQTFTPSNNYKFTFNPDEDDQKKEVLNELLPGALLKFSGHIVLYLGEDNGEYYVISAVGSYVNPTGAISVQSINTIAITSLSVRRGNGYTWLTNMTDFVVPYDFS